MRHQDFDKRAAHVAGGITYQVDVDSAPLPKAEEATLDSSQPSTASQPESTTVLLQDVERVHRFSATLHALAFKPSSVTPATNANPQPCTTRMSRSKECAKLSTCLKTTGCNPAGILTGRPGPNSPKPAPTGSARFSPIAQSPRQH